MAKTDGKEKSSEEFPPLSSNGKKSIECEPSFDQVRKLVKKEGIEAKNLVSWHVPLNETLSVDTNVNEEGTIVVNSEVKPDAVPSNQSEIVVAEIPKDKPSTPSTALRTTAATKGVVAKRSDFRSRQWSYLFDNLRRTVDAIYDTCYVDQSIIECKEAIMILENCTKDFNALIDYLNNQEVWEKSDKPISMAWEVRKTAGSPNKHFHPPISSRGEPVRANLNFGNSLMASNLQGSENIPPQPDGSIVQQINAPPPPRTRRRPRPARLIPATYSFEPVVLPLPKVQPPPPEAEKPIDHPPPPPLVPSEIKVAILEQQNSMVDSGIIDPPSLEIGPDVSEGKANDDEGWEVVRYNRGRRSSSEGKMDKSPSLNDLSMNAEHQSRMDDPHYQQQVSPKFPPSNPGGAKPSRSSIFPRNAQEIRQTKASLGKMAYNRQYLADQRQREIADKIKMFDHRSAPTHSVGRRRAFATSGSSISLPSLSTRIGINFSDPEAVRRSAQALKAALLKGGGRSRRFRSYQSMESVQSLESIKEEDVDKDLLAKMVEHLEVAADQPEESSQEKNDQSVTEGETVADATVEEKSIIEGTPYDRDETTEDGAEGIDDEEISTTAVPDDDVPDPECDETWRHLTEEEESLAQEEEYIQKEMEEERKSIDIEMSRPIEDDEVDEGDSNEAKEAEDEMQASGDRQMSPTVDAKPMSWQELVARWESGPFSRPNLNWGDMMEMELADIRSPGQVVQVHEKLSSPSRQRNLSEAIKKREERRVKAHEMRQQILEHRHQRMRELSKRVEEVQEARRCLVEKKKEILEERLAKAHENRHILLLARIKKAHDEDEKVNEIAFINNLEADNKRLDVKYRQQDLESRLQTIQDERQRRVDEKAAREAAAEERRKNADEQRQTKLLERAERTKRRQVEIEQQRSEHERERQQIAREKAREREERLAEMKAVKQANTEELMHRIQQRQEESMRRHEENLEQIKQRASEMSTPRSASSLAHGYDVSAMEMLRPPSCQPYVKQKLCALCNILIPTDVHLLAHLRGNRHAAALKDALLGTTLTKELSEQENQKAIIEASDDKVEALSPSPVAASDRAKLNRKRRQRLRQKLQAKSKEYMTNSTKPSTPPAWQSSPQLQKLIKANRDIGRCLENCGLDKQWLSADIHTLERAIGEMTRILSQPGSEKEQEAFHGSKIQDQALLLLSVLEKQNAADVTRLPIRSVLNICNMLRLSSANNSVTSVDMMYSNRISSCIEALAFQMQCLNQDKIGAGGKQQGGGQKAIPQETVVLQLMSLVTTQLDEIAKVLKNGQFGEWHSGEGGFRSRVPLVLSYLIACGVVDQFGTYCSAIVDLPSDGIQRDLILGGYRLLTTMLKCLLFSTGSVRSISEDATQLLEAIRCTELCNLMPILYSVLLSPNTISSTSGDRQTPPKLPDSTISFVATALDFVNATGAASWQLLQDILGQEGCSLEFRHVASFLISYGNRYECQVVLHRIISSVGYFTVMNAENQALVHFGSQPSILQQLCVLPFAYFSDKKLTRILYPTLIACSFQNEPNRYLLEQELSCTLLSDFLKLRMDSNLDKTVKNETDDELYSVEWRFPRDEWKNAIDYFDTPSTA